MYDYENRTITTTDFYGNKVSDYGIKNGRVDYLTLSKCFNCIRNNEIINITYDWELVSGTRPDEDTEIAQYYIIDNLGADILKIWTDELVFYSEEYNMYVWGVVHYGTSWDYVLTNIKICV